jgi:pimeloyl-ACP methyl ester carboxylesterase
MAPSDSLTSPSPLDLAVTDQVAAANASGQRPVFIHGLWLLPSSWSRWAALFVEAGYAPVCPGWPDDPGSVADANANPEVFAGKTVGQVADHTSEVIKQLRMRSAVIGHSFGGLIAQIIAGRGQSAATVAIDGAPYRGVLPDQPDHSQSPPGTPSTSPSSGTSTATNSYRRLQHPIPERPAESLNAKSHHASTGVKPQRSQWQA